MINAALADQPLAAAAVVAAWCASGLLVAGVLARRGHSLRHVGALGIVLGPLLIGLVLANLRWKERYATPVVLRAARPLGGTDRVLVALLGDPSTVADVLPVLRSAGDRLGHVDIGCPISFEDADRAGDPGTVTDAPSRQAVAELEQAAVFLEEFRPGLVLLPGRAADAVARYVESEDADLVVIAGDQGVQSDLCRDRKLRTVTMVLGSSPAGN